MTGLISPQEWEALSAYLDNQLNAQERARLENRLREQADLRSALEELRHLRAFLRNQPRLRAPRNFSLTPEMAGFRQGAYPVARSGKGLGARRGRSSPPAHAAYPTLRLAFALASFFFMVVFFGDLATRSLLPTHAVMNQEQFFAVEAPVEGRGGGGGLGGQDQPELAPPAPVFAPTEAPALGKAVQPPAAMAEAQAVVVTPQAMPDQATSTPLLEEGGVGERTFRDAGASENVAPPAQPAQVARVPGLVVRARLFLHILQILLGLMVVGCGLALIYLRRTGRE